MAKYLVEDYNLSIKTTQEDIDYIDLELCLVNSGGNKTFKRYSLGSDNNYSLDNIEINVINGLQTAKENMIKIEISEYTDRFYVTLTLPEIKNGKVTKNSPRYTTLKI